MIARLRRLLRLCYLLFMWLLIAEDSAAQEIAERLFATLERINSRHRVKAELQDEFYQEITGGSTLPVPQIGHVAVRDTNTVSNLLIR